MLRKQFVAALTGAVVVCCVAGFAGADVTNAKAPVSDWATLVLIKGDQLPLQNASEVKVSVKAKDVKLGEGRFGKAVDCSRGGVVSFTVPQAAQPTEELTLECWFYYHGRGKERLERIVGRSSNYGFYISGRVPRLTYFVKSGSKREDWKSIGAKVPVKKWTHIAGTYDGKMMKLYMDGKLIGQRENPGRAARSRGAYFLGTETARATMRFPGLIDGVRLSKIVRTDFFTGEPAPRPKPTARLIPVELKKDAFLPSLIVAKAALQDAGYGENRELN